MKPLAVMEYSQYHYYPFGLTMKGISNEASTIAPTNKRKFNDGTEFSNEEFLDRSGLEVYETPFRSYDPQIGRFHQIDELTDFDFGWSSYVFCHNNPLLFNDPLGLAVDSIIRPGLDEPKPGSRLAEVKILDEVIINAKKTNSRIGQPGLTESFIPVWGSGRAAIDDFQNDRWGWGTFNSIMVVADVFTLGGASTIAKGGIKLAAKEVAKESVYVISTRSGRYIGQSKHFLKRIAQHFGKGGKLSKEILEKILLHEMPGSTRLEREIYEQYLITNYGGIQGGQLLNKVNPMGGRMQEYAAKLEEVLKKYNLPR